jgi:hypothetical protein
MEIFLARKKSYARMFPQRAAAKMSAKITEAQNMAEAWRCHRGGEEGQP